MRHGIRKLLDIVFSILGAVLAIYVGGYWLFLRPVYFLVTAYKTATITPHLLIVCIIKILVASTAGGGIWCICDIIAGKFRDYYSTDD